MIEPPYESRAKRRRVIRAVSTSAGYVGRGRRRPLTRREHNFHSDRLFRLSKRSYNFRTRYKISPLWRKKYGW